MPGKVNIVWGGLDESDASAFADRLVKQKNAGLKPHDDAMEHISEKLGMRVEAAPEETEMVGAGGGKKKGKNGRKDD